MTTEPTIEQVIDDSKPLCEPTIRLEDVIDNTRPLCDPTFVISHFADALAHHLGDSEQDNRLYPLTVAEAKLRIEKFIELNGYRVTQGLIK